MREPGIVTVEFVSERRIDTRGTVVRLLDVQVEKCSVDAFGEETVHTLFHGCRIEVEV